MKKVLIFSALAGMITFYACKKGDTVTVTNTVRDTITNTVTVFASGKINGDSLAQAITLAYGTKVADSIFPAASADAAAPVLDTTFDRTYTVIRSRYLTIYPPNIAGRVEGYYVQIAGAKSYFKVDYPEAEAKRAAAKKANARQSAGNAGTTRGTGDGYIDSALVFKLPASVRGDTFYIKYAAYDQENRVSRPVTAMVVFLPAGNEATTTALTGTWRYMYYTYNQFAGGDRVFADWIIDTTYSYTQYYTCNGTTLAAAEQVTDYLLPYRIDNFNSGYQLGKYSMLNYYGGFSQQLNLSNSTCSNPVYDFFTNESGKDEGGYSYDSATKRITFIIDGNSNLNLNYDSYYLSELTDSTMIISDSNENSDDNNISLYKYIKQ